MVHAVSCSNTFYLSIADTGLVNVGKLSFSVQDIIGHGSQGTVVYRYIVQCMYVHVHVRIQIYKYIAIFTIIHTVRVKKTCPNMRAE